MQIKSIVAVAAIALAATIGSASAADQFTTLDGVTAGPLSQPEMAAVRGSAVTVLLRDAGGNLLDPQSINIPTPLSMVGVLIRITIGSGPRQVGSIIVNHPGGTVNLPQ